MLLHGNTKKSHYQQIDNLLEKLLSHLIYVTY